MEIVSNTHPEYDRLSPYWQKYRLTYTGGREFIEKYLKQYSAREDPFSFTKRKEISYCPAHSKSAITEIKNSIFQRMIDILRKDVPISFLEVSSGQLGGVDRTGSSMNSFIGTKVLPELMSMGRVGIFVDRPVLDSKSTIASQKNKRPYMYMYKTEDIRNWTYTNGVLTNVLLRDTSEVKNEEGFVRGTEETYRTLVLEDNGVIFTKYDGSGKEIETLHLQLTAIPFTIIELNESLLTDVCDYQVALLNLASSDLEYAIKSNFPFYTEQYSPHIDASYGVIASTGATAEGATVGKDKEIVVGSTQGRRYPTGVDRPGFISPPSEPLKVSMEKQSKLEQEIRSLIQLNLVSQGSDYASGESKSMDLQGLEAGLAYLGYMLQKGEQQLLETWADYEKTTLVPIVIYPATYAIRSDEDRRKEAKELFEQITKIPSLALQKEAMSYIARLLLGHKIDSEQFDSVVKDLGNLKTMIVNPETLIRHIEIGLVDLETASTLSGYPAGTVEKAKKDHIDRAIRIAEAQGGIANAANNGAIKDLDPSNGQDAIDQKTESQSSELNDLPVKKTRGEQK